MSYGLQLFRRSLQASSSQQVHMLRKNLFPVYDFLALTLGNPPRHSIYDQYDAAINQDVLAFIIDAHNKLNASWTWSNANRVEISDFAGKED